MKSFKDICKLSQPELKEYMQNFLRNYKYSVVNKDGFLYAKGDVPVLVVAHLDTVHKKLPAEIHEKSGIIDSPHGIGGDDRCGIFIIMNLVKELHCSVLLCEDEEVGGKGARAFIGSEYVSSLDVNYIVEFDRRGKDDAVFYQCDNKEFTKFITSTTGYKEANGSFSDISVIAPVAKLAAVNLSCGYYNAHTEKEYVVYKQMMNTLEVAKKLIQTENKKFEYVRRAYEWSSAFGNNYDRYSYQNTPNKKFDAHRYSSFVSEGQLSFPGTTRGKDPALDFELQLEVVWIDERNEETAEYVSGRTKEECWAKFFIENPEVSYGMVVDYSFD